jgi:hypothetical protein
MMKAINPKDDIFIQFCIGLFIVIVLFGLGMFGVYVFVDSAAGGKMLAVFASMFSSVVGLGSGYMLGRQSANGGSYASADDGHTVEPSS